MTEILAAVTDVLALIPTIFTTITGNPFFLFLLATSLVPIGIGVFRSIKNASKSK